VARFDIYQHDVGLIVDLQTNLIDGLKTRLVAPLIPLERAPRPAGRLNPVLDIDGELYSLQPHLMTAVAENTLGRPVGNILRHYDRIVSAIDMVFNGF
jgi:toxin CcdB